MKGQETASLVVLVVIGLAIGAWQLAILVNWRGYGNRHILRSAKTAATVRRLPVYRQLLPPESELSVKRYAKPVQKIVATVFLLVSLTLVGAAGSTLLNRLIA